MKTTRFTLRPLLLALSIFGLAQGLGSDVFAQLPAGNLTVTVQELEDGDVSFTLAGSAPLKTETGFSSSGYDETTKTPPSTATIWENFALPGGLMLSAGGFDYPLNYAYFSNTGYWFLGTFSSSSFPQGTNVVGSGSGTSSTIPFSRFVPGTHVVTSGSFDITYRVLPVPEPALEPPLLSLDNPSRFPATKVGRRSRPKTVRIYNDGETTATGLSVRASGRASRDYLLTRPRTTLAPEGSTLFRVTFRPRSKGVRRATVTVRAANATPSRAALLGTGKRS